ncbi:hypothetical protein CLOM_g15272 [Closterium sp. NIES-68]|nr:hypothetical protein CLOM_g15272 [Closterium sp. NIES-68]GJP86979.1 hypothetical protein CLOP_g16953 [Closterium sp. NIES-67]
MRSSAVTILMRERQTNAGTGGEVDGSADGVILEDVILAEVVGVEVTLAEAVGVEATQAEGAVGEMAAVAEVEIEDKRLATLCCSKMYISIECYEL